MKSTFDEKGSDTAQVLFNSIMILKFMADLKGLTDIYRELSKLSFSLQTVNSLMW